MPLVLLVISFFFGIDLHAVRFDVWSRCSMSSCSLPARSLMSSANRKLVMVHPAMLTVPSCSSSTSDIILSRKIL